MEQKTKLLDQVRHFMRLKQYHRNTERDYISCIKQFILYHNKKHPLDMNEGHVQAFLTYLAVYRKPSASAQNKALNAIVLLYKHVLHRPLGNVSGVLRAKTGYRLPVVLTEPEVTLLLNCLENTQYKLIIRLMYGSGMELRETVCTRVQDLDFVTNTVTVRGEKGRKNRVTILPQSIQAEIRVHLKRMKSLYCQDRTDGVADVCFPGPMAEKYPSAANSWNWQYVFPSDRRSRDPGTRRLRRHHVSERSVNKAIRKAVGLAGIQKHVTSRVLRHSFATHLLEAGTNIRAVQELMGHKNIKTTMIYLHCLNTPGETVTSPLDQL